MSRLKRIARFPGVSRAWVILAFGALAMASPAQAAYVFADFNIPGGGQPFSFTNNVTSASLSAVNVAVTFNFTAATGLGTADRGAYLNLGPVSPPSAFTPATGSTVIDQPVSNLEKLTLTAGTGGTGTNFLTLFFTGDLTGLASGNQGSILGSDSNPAAPRIVAYTSDFGTFTTPGNGFNLALSNISPTLTIGPGGFLNSFVSDISGTFTGNFTATVPEPASAAMLGVGFVGAFALARSRRARSSRRVLR